MKTYYVVVCLRNENGESAGFLAMIGPFTSVDGRTWLFRKGFTKDEGAERWQTTLHRFVMDKKEWESVFSTHGFVAHFCPALVPSETVFGKI